MGANQINTEIVEALGLAGKNVVALDLSLRSGEPPRLTVQTLLIEAEKLGFNVKTVLSNYTLVAADPIVVQDPVVAQHPNT